MEVAFLSYTLILFNVLVASVCSTGHFENVARGKMCNMSSLWVTSRHANAAVNGNTGGRWGGTNNCIHSGSNDQSPWWEVNLGRPYPVYRIIVFARTGFVQRMSDCIITVDEQECYRFGTVQSFHVRKFNITCTRVTNGSVVRVQRKSSSSWEYTMNICEVEVYSCSDPYWGSGCNRECGHCSDGEVCNKVTGHCSSCSVGWAPPQCDQACPDGTFGHNCTQYCSEGCDDVCNKVSGNCSCGLGWQGTSCDSACPDGTFGHNCTQHCSEGCDDVCDKVSGNCSCGPGWQGTSCDSACPDGTFGHNCTQHCSERCDDFCDKVSGNCSCGPGWQGTSCNSACPDGTFGHNCTQHCSEGCDDVCEKVFGNCSCGPGWQGTSCDSECDRGMYGKGCTELCGQCEGIETCHHVTGNCSICSSDFVLPLCKLKAVASTQMISAGVLAGSVAGAVVVLLVAVAVVVVIVRRRRTGSKESTKQDVQKIDEVAFEHATQDNVYENVENTHDVTTTKSSEKTEKKARSKLGIVSPVGAFKQRRKKKKPSSSTSYVNVGMSNCDGNITVHIEENIVSVDRAFSTVTLQSTEQEAEEEVEEVEPEGAVYAERGSDMAAREQVYHNDDVYMRSEGSSLQLDSVQQYLLDKLSGDDMDTEFEALPGGLVKTHDSGAKDENYYRNRFTSILPYEDTRVVLRGDPDPGSNDYINASYIRGQRSAKAYIAAQGPKRSTLGDFWKMVWQEKVTHIVMLTNVKEGKKKKCEEYWPCPGTKQRYGSVDVTGQEVHERTYHVTRTFDVKAGKEAARHVTQYHYTTWPDHGIPTTIALVDFWRTVKSSHRNQKPASPLLVHCSAGVGRTGTFIALDVLMDRIEHQEQVDVFEVVESMRSDRCNMVQAKSQYRFLHEALFEAYTSRDCRLSVSCLDTVFRQPVDPHRSNQRIDTQFKKLKQMKVFLHKPCHTEATKEENLNKNRCLDVLPGDGQLVRLTLPVLGRNDYINAVDLLTLGERRRFILTQLPLPDTVVDLWRLVAGNDVNMVVSIGCETDDVAERNCYWPRKRGQYMTLGPIFVRLTSLSSLGQHLKQYTLSVQYPDKAQPREVQLLHYGGWKGEIAGSAQDLAQLVDIVLSTTPPQGQNSRPVVVQCDNGATKSGLFCAMCDTISRMTSDGEIDVYMAVRNIHVIRPESVTSQVQYRFIYRTVQEYTARNATYCNISSSNC